MHYGHFLNFSTKHLALGGNNDFWKQNKNAVTKFKIHKQVLNQIFQKWP